MGCPLIRVEIGAREIRRAWRELQRTAPSLFEVAPVADVQIRWEEWDPATEIQARLADVSYCVTRITAGPYLKNGVPFVRVQIPSKVLEGAIRDLAGRGKRNFKAPAARRRAA